MAMLLTGRAQAAELCDAPTHICIVNPPTAASPWIAPQLVQLRLPAEANPNYSGASWSQPGVYPQALESGGYPIKGGLQLIEQGAPGGTSLYQGTIEPGFSAGPNGNSFLPADGALTLTVEARASDPICECVKPFATTAFAGLPVLGAITGFNWRIVRSGKWFRAIMSLEARTPIRIEQIFHVSGFEKKGGVDFFPRPLMTRQVTGTGPLQMVQKLSARYVEHKCSGYQRCRLYAEGQMGSAAEPHLADGLLSSVSRPVMIRQK